jgi:ssDNA-binding Zn-finger/Zn-ribbon topoisomerase 1
VKNENVISTYSDKNHAKNKKIEENALTDVLEDAEEPFCLKRGSKMVLRKARKGKCAGKSIWGRTTFPKCNGILNIF